MSFHRRVAFAGRVLQALPVEDPDPPVRVSFARFASSASGRNTRTLAQLVDDVLDVSRMISGKMRLDTVAMDLGETASTPWPQASMTIWPNPSSPQPWHRRSLLLPRCATGDRRPAVVCTTRASPGVAHRFVGAARLGAVPAALHRAPPSPAVAARVEEEPPASLAAALMPRALRGCPLRPSAWRATCIRAREGAGS